MVTGNKRWILHISLFAATFVIASLAQGPLYAVVLLSILLAHELGHYSMCRRHGVAATLPFFIPFPNLFGTMGAVISIRSPIPSRRALFDIGVSGPLFGLALAIPAIAIGLFFSKIAPIPTEFGMSLGEPLLFHWLSQHILGTPPPGYDVILHPVAFAGWVVLFVTSINLFPVGQLDGGHIVYALLGKRAKFVSWLAIPALAYLGYAYNPMWYFFLVIILIFIWKHPAPIDDATPIDGKRIFFALLTFALFVLCFTPVPIDYRP